MNEMFDSFCEKINSEYAEFENALKSTSAENVVQCAYELVLKRELANLLTGDSVFFETWSVTDQARVLNIPNILDCIYQVWLKLDFSFQETLESFIEYSIKEYPLPEPATSVFSD